jgi:integrase
MQLNSYLVKSRHGIYYLRVQRRGVDRRVSLRTRDPERARISAYKFGVFMANNEFGFDFSNISKWEVKTKEFEIKTDGTDKDNAEGLKALAILVGGQKSQATKLVSTSLRDAIKEYEPFLAKTKQAEKSKKMAMSTLNNFVTLLGADFDMALIDDALVEEKWIPKRLSEVADTTVKRDLSFIRKFVEWAADSKRMYCSAPLTLTFDAESEHYEYFDANDLRLLFDAVPSKAKNAWQFWIPLIGLYTGARISEPASMKVEHVFNKTELDIMHLPGTKTDASPRDIPIHPDLISIGFLDYVNYRKSLGKEMLFDVTFSKQNGYGAAPSKWFGNLKRDVGITHEMKVFHSFRHTITDHLNQHGAQFEASSQYTGHSKGGGVKGQVYGRRLLNLSVLKAEVVDKINWKKYCSWSPDIVLLKRKAKSLIAGKNENKTTDLEKISDTYNWLVRDQI